MGIPKVFGMSRRVGTLGIDSAGATAKQTPVPKVNHRLLQGVILSVGSHNKVRLVVEGSRKYDALPRLPSLLSPPKSPSGFIVRPRWRVQLSTFSLPSPSLLYYLVKPHAAVPIA